MVKEKRLNQRREDSYWEDIFRANYKALLSFATRRLDGDSESAKDLVAEAFYRAVTNVEHMESTGASPESWIYGILKNVISEFKRERANLGLSTMYADPEAPYPESDWLEEDYDLLEEAFKTLKKREKEVLELRIVAGLNSAEVAAILNLNPGFVRMIQTRALQRLRIKIREIQLQRSAVKTGFSQKKPSIKVTS
jgi:RNA polymerase sigma factor (sigma-70 family)